MRLNLQAYVPASNVRDSTVQSGFFPMNKTRCIFARFVVLAIMLNSVSINAAEFHEDDILPIISSLMFTQEAIVMTLETSTYLGKETMHFAAKRNDYKFRGVTDQEYSGPLAANYYHRKLSGKIRLRERDGQYELDQRDLSLRTENGCAPESRVPTHVSHEEFQFTINLQCAARIYDAVRNNNRLWMATYIDPEFSYNYEISQEGVIVASLAGREEARIDVGNHAIHGLAVDPWTQDVWIVTQDRLMQVTQEFDVERQFWPILDFAEANGRPSTFVKESSKRLLSNPLALVARGVGESYYQKFYNAIKELPDSWDQGIMYSYAMNGPDWASNPILPKQLNVLIEDAIPTGGWRRFVCLLDDERAKKLCSLDLDYWP